MPSIIARRLKPYLGSMNPKLNRRLVVLVDAVQAFLNPDPNVSLDQSVAAQKALRQALDDLSRALDVVQSAE